MIAPADPEPPPSLRLLLEAASGLGICIGFGRFSVGLLLPAMQEDLDLGYSGMGLLASANFAAYLVGVGLMPALARRLGYRRLLQTGLLAASTGMLLLALPLPIPGVALALVMTGASGALGWVSAAAIGVTLGNGGDRGRILGIIGGAMGLGMIVASLLTLAASQIDPLPWRAIWGVQGVLAAGALMLARSGPPLGAAARRIRQPVHGVGGLRFAYAVFGMGYAIFATYFVAAVSHSGAGPAMAATRWAVVGAGACIGAYAFGAWSDRASRRRVLVASQLAALLSAGCVVADQRAIPLVAVLGGFLFGTVMTGMASLLPAALADILPDPLVPDAFASLTLIFAVSQVVSPMVGGAVLEAGGSFTLVFMLVVGCFLCSTIAFGRFTRASADLALWGR